MAIPPPFVSWSREAAHSLPVLDFDVKLTLLRVVLFVWWVYQVSTE